MEQMSFSIPSSSTESEPKDGYYDYDIFFLLDIECQEILDSIGISYEISEEDKNTYEILLTLNEEEFNDIFDNLQVKNIDEKIITSNLLNPELAEYTKKIIIEKPNGHKISFY